MSITIERQHFVPIFLQRDDDDSMEYLRLNLEWVLEKKIKAPSIIGIFDI